MFQNHSLGNYCSWFWTKNFRIFAKIHCNLCFRIVCKLHFRLIIYNDWLALCKIHKVFWKSEVKSIHFTVMYLATTDFGSKRGPLAWRKLWVCVRVLLVCDIGYKTLLFNEQKIHAYLSNSSSILYMSLAEGYLSLYRLCFWDAKKFKIEEWSLVNVTLIYFRLIFTKNSWMRL